MKKLTILLLAVFFVLTVAPVYADHQRGDPSCGDSPCPITSRLMRKACFLLGHADEIGLSEDQVKQIQTIRMDAKKDMIRGEAEMQIAHMDLQAKLQEEVLDVEGLNAMVDTFGANMITGAKKAVERYAALRAVLKPEQAAKAKEIWKRK